MLPTGPEEWEKVFIDPGAVIIHDGQFHSFYNGVGDWPTHARIGHASSGDGWSWEKQSVDGLFSGDGLDWSGVSIFVHDGLVLEDGTWALYFSTAKSSHDLFTGVIGMATAPAAAGPWTVHPVPVLEPGPVGAWDVDSVVSPTVVAVGDQLWMYYSGSGAGDRSIGLAISDDGYDWTKYDDPFTSDVVDPVMTSGPRGEWDERGLFNPQVVISEEGFVMSYLTHGDGTAASIHQLGLAFSDDGIAWERDTAGPFFSSDKWGFASILLSNLVHHDDRYIIYFDGERSSGGTTAYYTSHEGSLRP